MAVVMSTYEDDIEASLRKYGYHTMCPFCGWSLLEPGHDYAECMSVANEMIERADEEGEV